MKIVAYVSSYAGWKSEVKRIFVVFIVGSVACLAIIGALSVVPHAHDNDFNHSEHASCPIHQLGQYGFQAVIGGFGIAIAFSFIFYLFTFVDRSAITFPSRFFLVRAPPALL